VLGIGIRGPGWSVALSDAFDVFDGPVSAFGSTVRDAGIEVREELGFPRRNRSRTLISSRIGWSAT
jgi:hypothetical protein